MPPQSIQDRLPELKQIEAIIKQYQHDSLTCTTLCQIPYQNQSIPIYELSLGNRAADLPSITFIGGVHGLERIGTQLVISFLETLLQRLRWDFTLEDALKRVRINFLPLVNPVGMISHTRANGEGVDLMRNAPIDSNEKTVWLAGGHRISPLIPWYRGPIDQPMQTEAQILCDYIRGAVFSSPFSLVLDCHSGFGYHNQIWFPYAKSRVEPIKHLGEVYFLRKLLFQTYPYQNYRFEPQSQHYLTHGDLWDFLYLESLNNGNFFLPLTLEMGSWRWIRKNPLQLRRLLGLFHPIKPHRINRVLRGHLMLMDFLIHATLSYQKWLGDSSSDEMEQQALNLWYRQ